MSEAEEEDGASRDGEDDALGGDVPVEAPPEPVDPEPGPEPVHA